MLVELIDFVYQYQVVFVFDLVADHLFQVTYLYLAHPSVVLIDQEPRFVIQDPRQSDPTVQ